MTSVISRAIAAIRVWLGMNDPAQDRLYPSHGWLLPLPVDVRARQLDQALRLAPVPMTPSASGHRR
jgi:hypothetical protein